MTAYKSLIHQGHHAKLHSNATIEDCPYPANSNAAKEWRQGWAKAQKSEPWSEPRRRSKRNVE